MVLTLKGTAEAPGLLPVGLFCHRHTGKPKISASAIIFDKLIVRMAPANEFSHGLDTILERCGI